MHEILTIVNIQVQIELFYNRNCIYSSCLNDDPCAVIPGITIRELLTM